MKTPAKYVIGAKEVAQTLNFSYTGTEMVEKKLREEFGITPVHKVKGTYKGKTVFRPLYNPEDLLNPEERKLRAKRKELEHKQQAIAEEMKLLDQQIEEANVLHLRRA